MAVRVQQRRSSTASKRPTNAILEGEIALNFNDGTPGAFFKNASGNIVKLGPAEVSGTAPNGSPAGGGSAGNSTGEMWYDTSTNALKVWDGAAWVSSASGILVDGDTSVSVDGTADTVTFNTGGTDRWVIDASGHFVPAADSTYNLGASGTEVAAAFIDTVNVSTSADLLGQAPVRYYDADSSNFIAFIAPATVAADVTFTLPAADGTANQVLTTDGSATLSWTEASTNDITDGDTSVSVDGTTDIINFETAGTDQWQINAAGDFLPQNATQDIGSAGTPVQDVFAGNLTGTLLTVSQTNVTGVGTLTAGTWNADIIAPLYGGTGLDGSSAANGELLIGNGSGYALSTLTAGQSVGITNAAGSITLAADLAQGAAASAAANAGVASFDTADFTVDAAGFVQIAGSASASSILADDGNTAAPVGGQLIASGDTGISTTASGNTIEIDLDDTAVTAAAYGAADTVATFTVDQQGRLTAAADVAVAILHTAVTDFDAGVQTNTLDSMAAPVASVSMNSQLLTDVLDPVNDQDAATKIYVDTVAQGLDAKDAARAATTANITLSGTQTVDGVALVAGDRILVKDQTTQSENGIYDVAAGAWARSEDADTWDDLVSAFIFVSEGTTNADNGFVMTADAGGTIGTTPVIWTQFSGAGSVIAGTGLTKSGNTIDANGTLNRILVNADDIDISPNYVGQASLTTLGTITTGTWNADIVGLAYGGTAVDNTNITDGEIFMGPNFVDGTSPGSAGFREFLTTDVAPITGGSFDGGTF